MLRRRTLFPVVGHQLSSSRDALDRPSVERGNSLIVNVESFALGHDKLDEGRDTSVTLGADALHPVAVRFTVTSQTASQLSSLFSSLNQ